MNYMVLRIKYIVGDDFQSIFFYRESFWIGTYSIDNKRIVSYSDSKNEVELMENHLNNLGLEIKNKDIFKL